MPFIDYTNMEVDIERMVSHYISRSKIDFELIKKLSRILEFCIGGNLDFINISSGKDFIAILATALHKHFKCCKSQDSTIEILSRTFRIAVTKEDLKIKLSCYEILVEHIRNTKFRWVGQPL